MVNEAFNRKLSLLTSKLNTELRKKLLRCYIWSIAGDVDTKKIGEEVFGKLRNVVPEENGEDKRAKKVTNEEVLELLNNILRRSQLGKSYSEKKLSSS